MLDCWGSGGPKTAQSVRKWNESRGATKYEILESGWNSFRLDNRRALEQSIAAGAQAAIEVLRSIEGLEDGQAERGEGLGQQSLGGRAQAELVVSRNMRLQLEWL